MSKKILVIDADANLVGQVTSDLEGKGFEVLHTSDGKEGIDLARQHRPELVVLCVELPRANGYAICRQLRKDDDLRSIRVILTSAEASQKAFDDHKKLKMGRADEYLLKPFQMSALAGKVEGLIGLPEGGADEPLDVSGLAEEVSVSGEEPVTIEEVEEIPVEDQDAAPTPSSLPGDEDLAMLDAAFEHIEEKKQEEPEALAPNGHAAGFLEEAEVVAEVEPEPAMAADEDEQLLGALEEHPAPAVGQDEPFQPPPAAADSEELERLHGEIASLKQQLESAADARATASGSRDKDYFAAKEKLAQREREMVRLREELNEKDKELVDQRDKEMQLEQQIAGHDQELAKRDAQIKTLQQKVDALVAGQKRTERDLAQSREEAKQATAKAQAAEAELSTVQAAAAEHESTAQRVTQEFETANARVSELESDLNSERSRTDELSAELHGTRTQLEEAQTTVDELRRRVSDLEDQGAKNEDRVVKAYQRIKGDEKVKEKVKKALGIALQLLEEAGVEVEATDSDEERP